MLCGSRFAPASYAGTPVEHMLPVAFDAEAEWEDVDDGVYPVLTPEGRSSLVMTLESDQDENDLVWSRVAPLDRIPPLACSWASQTRFALNQSPRSQQRVQCLRMLGSR